MKSSKRLAFLAFLLLDVLTMRPISAQPQQMMIQCVVNGRCPQGAADPSIRDGFAIQLAVVNHYNASTMLPVMPMLPAPGGRMKAPEPPADDAASLVLGGNNMAVEGNYAGATTQFQDALRLAPDSQDFQAKGAALTGLGAVLAVQGRYPEARDRLQQALQAYIDLAAKPIAPSASPAAIAKSQAAMAQQLARYGVDATQYALNASTGSLVEIANQIERQAAQSGIVRSMLNLGNLMGQLGQYTEAESHLQRALGQARTGQEHDDSGAVLFELAILYRVAGKSAEANAWRQQAEAKQAPQSLALSGGLVALGRSAVRAPVAEAAPGGIEKGPSHQVETVQQGLQADAEAAESAHDAMTAITAYSHSATLAIAMNNPERERFALAQQQRLLEAQGECDTAIFFGKRAVNAAQRLRSSVNGMDRQARQAFLADKRRSYTSLVRLLIDADRLDEAELVLRLLKEDEGQQFVDNAAKLAHGEVPYSASEATLLARYEVFARRTGELEQRREQLSAQLLGRSIDSRKAQEELRLTFLRQMESLMQGFETSLTPERLADAKARYLAAAAKPAASRNAEDRKAFGEYGMSMRFLQDRVARLAAALRALQRDAPRFLTPPSTSELARIAALQARATRFESALIPSLTGLPDAGATEPLPAMPKILAMYLGGATDAVQAYWAIDRELEGIDADRAALDASAAAEIGRAVTRRFSEAARATLEAGRTLLGALPAGTVAIYYLSSDDRLDELLVTRDARHAFRQSLPRQSLDRQIQAFRIVLQDPSRDVRPSASALYEVLLAPLAGALRAAGAKTLMLALDGQLRYLPFAALHDDQGWLAERYAFDLYTTAAPAALTVLPAVRWQVAAFGSTRGGANFDPLPGVRTELASIVRDPKQPAQGVLAGSARLDGEFTAAALKNAFHSGANVVHIASHFRFSPGDAAQSYLLLGDGSTLTLAQLAAPDYRFDRVDLVTLSACETGLNGDDRFGQEIEGMGTLFQGQGAAAVLATLWSVADQSTADFMRALYSAREQRKLSRAEAVREAQLLLIGGDARLPAGGTARGATRPSVAGSSALAPADPARPYAHPFYWAPFVLMGNWL